MPLFTWYQKYSVNNEELDRHHKTLFDIFNRLYDKCLKAKGTDCVQPVINELLSYADYHFKAEEQYMKDTAYRDLLKHCQMHSYFIEKAMQMQKVENKEDLELTKELTVFLGNWLLHHVIEEDGKYKI